MENQYENTETAVTYDRSEKIKQDGMARVAAMRLWPGMKVLDIGSGPGVLAIPLAKRGCEVTAVEPSEAMRCLLNQHKEEEQVCNIKILPYTWEDVPEAKLDQYDLVIASYSLFMPDFGAAALKMNRHSRGQIVLYWFAGETSWERDKRILYSRLRRKEKSVHSPKIDELYRILYEMEFYADITMLSDTSFDREYGHFEEAVLDMEKRYGLAKSERSVLEEYLKERLEEQNGRWFYRDRTHYAKLSWQAVPVKDGGSK